MENITENRPLQNSSLMPGPQFGNDKDSQNPLKRHFPKIILGAIVVLIALGGFLLYQNYQTQKTAIQSALNNNSGSPSSTPSPTASPISSPIAASNLNAQKISQAPQNISVPGQTAATGPAIIADRTDSEIIAQAVKGNGATHLARAALKEYLKDHPTEASRLKIEQKIYIEDYLRKHTAQPTKVLKINDKISFSTSLIQDAIAASQKLSDAQINNLSKYVPLVPSLNY